MKQDLKENHVREIDELKQKYEQTIGELQKNASSDKENVQIEFKGQVLTLEKKIEEIKKEHDNDNEKQMQQLQTTVKQFEDQISGTLEEHKRFVAELETNFSKSKLDF